MVASGTANACVIWSEESIWAFLKLKMSSRIFSRISDKAEILRFSD